MFSLSNLFYLLKYLSTFISLPCPYFSPSPLLSLYLPYSPFLILPHPFPSFLFSFLPFSPSLIIPPPFLPLIPPFFPYLHLPPLSDTLPPHVWQKFSQNNLPANVWILVNCVCRSPLALFLYSPLSFNLLITSYSYILLFPSIYS